ncbi:MAG: 5'/3'-nucleotidase SurE [Lachnospiraceae bacterium]|nr:5'/3'-nucleotidase SurE [Lachnospiraceae bacterium]
MRKILITNDDGIEAEGIVRLAKTAKKFGEVWIVAPEKQRSATSHSLTIDSFIDVWQHVFPVEGVNVYACSGHPTDCLRIGSKCIMPEKPDIIFSGINNGFNVGTDIQYSATVGAALDAALCGYPVIAFSEGFRGDEREKLFGHTITDMYLEKVMRELLDSGIKPGTVVNVNFPDCSPEEFKGILKDRKVGMDTPYIDNYREESKLPNGGTRYALIWTDRDHACEGTDLKAILDGYISIGIVNNIS